MKQITLYTGKHCWKCNALLSWLKDKAIPFIEKDAWKYEKLLLYDNNMMYVPVLEIDGKFYDSYEDMQRIIKESLKNG